MNQQFSFFLFIQMRAKIWRKMMKILFQSHRQRAILQDSLTLTLCIHMAKYTHPIRMWKMMPFLSTPHQQSLSLSLSRSVICSFALAIFFNFREKTFGIHFYLSGFSLFRTVPFHSSDLSHNRTNNTRCVCVCERERARAGYIPKGKQITQIHC